MTAPDHKPKLFKIQLARMGVSIHEPVRRALLHKSAEGRSSPFLGQTYPATSVTGVPSAVKPFRTATRTWNSATRRSKSLADRR